MAYLAFRDWTKHLLWFTKRSFCITPHLWFIYY